MIVTTVFWCAVIATLVVVLVAYFRERARAQEENLWEPQAFKNEFQSVYHRLKDIDHVSDEVWDRVYCDLRTAYLKFHLKDMEVAVIHLKRARNVVGLLEKQSG